MPLYEYKCLECGKTVELRISFEKSESTACVCPVCGTEMDRQTGTIATFSIRGKR